MDKDLGPDIKDAFEFLAQYQWIHDFQVTRIFSEEILKKIPDEWLPYVKQLSTDELNHVPFIGASSTEQFPSWPESLHNFLSRASELSIDRHQSKCLSPSVVDTNMARGMNPKKLHEVSWMASLVHDIMCEANCDLIVDIGSGLGYLDHVLHQVYGHPVLGLELSESHTCAAHTRALKQGLTCNGIKSIKFDISNTAECFQSLEEIVAGLSLSCHCGGPAQSQGYANRRDVTQTSGTNQSGGSLGTTSSSSSDPRPNPDTQSGAPCPRVCLIGLHCCGDLSVSALAMFDTMSCVKAVCCVCCCYHKMAAPSGDVTNFPVSLVGRQQFAVIRKSCLSFSISPFSLRLGAQETRQRWMGQTREEHEDHIRHVAYRGILQMSDEDETSSVRQRVRKCDFSSFDAFLTSFYSSAETTQEKIKTEMEHLRNLHEKHKDEFPLIEILTCLQVIVQPVLETLIYKDRVQWVKERGHTNFKVIPVFDEAISPRNLAIVAIKDM